MIIHLYFRIVSKILNALSLFRPTLQKLNPMA